MTDPQMKFAEGFAMPTYEQWVAEVEKALKGAPFDKRMYTKTYEGVTLRPIYTSQDWPSTGDPSGFPGATPFTRGGRAIRSAWNVRRTDIFIANRITYGDAASDFGSASTTGMPVRLMPIPIRRGAMTLSSGT